MIIRKISVFPGKNGVRFKLSFTNSNIPPLSSTVYGPGL